MSDRTFNSFEDSSDVREAQQPPLPILDYVQLLWFRRKLIFAITVFVSVIGYIQINQITNLYTATSTLMVGLPESQVVDVEAVLSRDSYYTDVESEIEVLRSDVIASKVAKRLNLINHPEFNPALRKPEESLFDFLKYLNPRTWIPQSWKNAVKEAFGQEVEYETGEWASPASQTPLDEEEEKQQKLIHNAAKILLGKMNFEQVGYSSLIRISATAMDPKIAAAVANDWPEAYILDQLEAKFEATQKANAWLTEQLSDLETKVVDSERAVVLFREQHGMTESKGTSILDSQLSELNSQLIIARAEKAEIDARLEQLRRLLSGGGAGVETASEVLSSTLIQEMRAQEAQALNRMSELSVEYGPKHPRMLQVQSEVAEIRERIRAEIERIVQGLEYEAEFAQTRVASIESDLREAQGETSEQNKEAIQLRSLEREAAANRALFETYLNRFKETSSTQGLQTSDARVLSQADVPGGPSYPDRNRMFWSYFIAGLLGGCGLVLGLHLLSPGISSPEQAQEVLGEYVIGLIPMLSGKSAVFDDVLDNPSSSLVEAINSLKFSMDLSNPDATVRAVQITSSVPEEGKTSLAIALARVVSTSGKKVILVDGDLRRSSLGKKLGLDEKFRGLSDLVVSPEEDLAEFILKDSKSTVSYLPTGTAKFANATDIFSSHRMETIVEQLKSRFDLIIVDSPPVMAVADARIIGRVVDKTLFVVRWDKTPRKVARAAIDQLRRAEVSLSGVILQQVDMKRYGRIGYGNSGYYYHYGRYGKYYSS